MPDSNLMRGALITTFDNPYSPYTQFDQWYWFDEQKGYHTCSLLARFAKTSDCLPQKTNNKIIEDAIDEIIKLFPDLYKKVIIEEEMQTVAEKYLNEIKEN